MENVKLVDKLIALVEDSEAILKKIHEFNEMFAVTNPLDKRNAIMEKVNGWFHRIQITLKLNGMKEDELMIQNIIGNSMMFSFKSAFHGLKDEEEKIRKINNELLAIVKSLKSKSSKRQIELITIDDIDNFKELLKNVNTKDLEGKYDSSAFLEDDVENCFMEVIGESPNYKEMDGAHEMRDLFTDRIFINGRRQASSIMFKGRGVNGELRISNCGSGGNQLLKLSKNASSELFIVQHVNKINPDVREALYDHLITHAAFTKIKICFIDGLDTARILKGAGKDLDKLVANKSNTGRKPKV